MCRARHTLSRSSRSEQEQQMAEGQVDESQDEHENPDARQDMAHVQARARQVRVPARDTGGTQGEEQETQTENEITAAHVVDKETTERGQDAGREPKEAAVGRNQPPRPIDRPKMPTFVLRARKKSGEIPHGDESDRRTLAESAVEAVIEVEKNPSGGLTLQGVVTQAAALPAECTDDRSVVKLTNTGAGGMLGTPIADGERAERAEALRSCSSEGYATYVAPGDW